MDIGAGFMPIPGYRLVSRLGLGGFGEVWKAEGPGGQSIALKIVELKQKQSDEELQALQLIATVRHPHLLHLLDHWVSDEFLLIATELADGTAAERARAHGERGEAGIPRPELLALMAQAAEAIDFLNAPVHDHAGRKVAIQHRDVKPENIFLSGDHVRVGDFGLVKILEKLSERHSGKGTLLYAPPEMLEGQISHASDQYSLALTYCKLATGELPFPGETALEKLWARVNTDPILDSLTIDEQPLVARALSRDPQARFPSCIAFIRSLQLAGQSAGMTTASLLEQSRSSTLFSGLTAVAPRIKGETTVNGSKRRGSSRPLPTGFTAVPGTPIHESSYPHEIVCELDGSEMVLVPGGEFFAGPPRSPGVYRRVHLSPYYIDKYPVTNAQFQWFTRSADYRRADRWAWGDDQTGLVNRSPHPAVWLTWDDALAYCQWSGRTLPTEAQWEKAARGVDGRHYPWGNETPTEESRRFCNLAITLDSPSSRTSPVGVRDQGVSPFGCHDMVGNVWEWCLDWYDAHPIALYRNPTGPPVGRFRCIRGGSWANGVELAPVWFRNHLAPEARGPTTGFRSVLCLENGSS